MKESSDVSMNIRRFFLKYILSSLWITLRQQQQNQQQCYQQQQSQQLRCQLRVSRRQQPDHTCYHNLQIRWQPLRLQQNKKSSSFFAIFNFYNRTNICPQNYLSLFFRTMLRNCFLNRSKNYTTKTQKSFNFLKYFSQVLENEMVVINYLFTLIIVP